MNKLFKNLLSVVLCMVIVVGLMPIASLATGSQDFVPQWPVHIEKYINALDHYSDGTLHRGMDIYSPEGTDVYPIANGTVVEFKNNCSGYSTDLWQGNYIILEHDVNGQKYHSAYMHLKKDTINVTYVGQAVQTNEVIAQSGNTGQSNGAHLHLEIYNVSKKETRYSAGFYTFSYYQNNAFGISIRESMVDASEYYGTWIKQNWERVKENNGVWYYKCTSTNTPTPPLAAPSNLTGSRSGTANVQLTWNAVSGATKYEAQYSRPGVSWTTLDESPTSTNSLLAKGFSWNYDYVDFRVRAVNSAGASAWTEVRVLKSGTAACSWDHSAGGKHDGAWTYKTVQKSDGSYTAVCKNCGVEYVLPALDTSKAGLYQFKLASESPNDPNVNGIGAEPYKESCTSCGVEGSQVTVIGSVTNAYGNVWYKTDGNRYVYSGYLTKATFPPPAAPTNLSGARSGTANVQLNWNAVSNASYYEAQYSRFGVDWTTLDESPAYTNSMLAKGFSWNYDYVDFRVRAVNSAGVSAWAVIRVNKENSPAPTPDPSPAPVPAPQDSGQDTKVSEFVIKDGALIGYNGPGGDVVIPSGVTSIGGDAFSDCSSLTSVTIPVGVTSIDAFAFTWCNNLTSVVIPFGVTSIGNNAFGCCGLTSVTIPDSVTKIGALAFSNCKNLTNITIPGSVTWIGDLAFSECDNLSSVAISDSVTHIGDWAFSNCGNLANVYFNGSQAQWSTIAIGVGNDELTSATIHFSVETNTDSQVPEYIEVKVDGVPVAWTDARPLIDSNNRTLVPLRAVAEAMGLDVSWDQSTRTASFIHTTVPEYSYREHQRTLSFTIGDPVAYGFCDVPNPSDGTIYRDKSTIQMDTTAVIINDRTYAPIRYLAEYFGYQVDWDGASKTVSLTSQYLEYSYPMMWDPEDTVVFLCFDPFINYEKVASVSYASAKADGVLTDAKDAPEVRTDGVVYALRVTLPKGYKNTSEVEVTLRFLLKDHTTQTRTWVAGLPHF